MRTFGLLSGMSDYSADFYLKLINRRMLEREGRQANVVPCASTRWRIGELARAERWDDLAEEMIRAVKIMRQAGAEFVVIPSFTLHRLADVVEAESEIPILRLDDCMARAIVRSKKQRVALLGADVAGRGFLQDFCQRIGQRECFWCGAYTMVDLNHITRDNQARNESLARSCFWTYIEGLQELAENGAELVLNCSVEMTRMIGVQNARVSLKERPSFKAPVLVAVDLHVNATVQACLSERDFFS